MKSFEHGSEVDRLKAMIVDLDAKLQRARIERNAAAADVQRRQHNIDDLRYRLQSLAETLVELEQNYTRMKGERDHLTHLLYEKRGIS